MMHPDVALQSPHSVQQTKTMASSISQQLEDLLNPLPKFTDPEDDQDEATKAKVIEKFDEGGEEDDYTSFTGLKKRSTRILEETDRRYAGKATSRKELQKLLAGSDEGEEEEEEDEDGEVGDSDELDDDHGDDDEEDMEEEEEDDEEVMDSDEDSPVKNKLATKLKSDISFPKVTDFHKLTEGMDDLGMSEEDEDGESGEEDEDSSEGEEEDDEEVDDDDDDDEDDDAEEDDAVMTFSKEKVDEEVEKGKCVKNQLALWDQLLEGRIKIQKALATANQLPQPQTFPEFKNKGGAQFSGALKNSHKALKALQRSLLDLQDLLLLQSTETKPIAQGKAWSADSKSKALEDSDQDEEIESEEEDEDGDEGEEKKGVRNGGPPKRKLEMSEYPDFMAKRFANFEPYRNSTLQKWYDKTRLTMGKTTKGFGSFDRNILTQVDHVLMDKERLVRRTQTRRSQFRVLGKPEITAPVLEPATTEKEEVERAVLKANAHLKDLDQEIFDDSDFYHQLLRELIERKTSAADPNDQVAMGRQWLAIQKLRSKIKKKVDTKASKGRKIRFHIHSKLVNFMAPVDHSSMHDEARTELYRSLFGGNTLTGAPQREGQ